MPAHKGASEPAHTTPKRASRAPAPPTDLDAYRAHYAATTDFTSALRDGRCRRTNHYDARLGETLAVFKPLFAPWNVEIAFTLYMRGPQRFNALKRHLAGVSSRVLTDKLRHLTDAGLLARDESDGIARYGLTARGRVVATTLHPLVFYLHNEAALAGSLPSSLVTSSVT